MLPVVLVHLGAAAALAGGLALALSALSVAHDGLSIGALLLGTGVLTAIAGLRWPASTICVTSRHSHLDAFVPEWQFAETHSIVARATPRSAYDAVKAVTAREVSFFRTLTWIRRAGRPGSASILNPPADEPLLDVATRTSFLTLADEPDKEAVVGIPVLCPPGWRPVERLTPEGFCALRQPGFALAAMNFRIEEVENGCRVTTETRIYAADVAARQRFALYWRLIYPGSALIRRMWLRAIKRRAEAQTGARVPADDPAR
jgi:hypothetical protein